MELASKYDPQDVEGKWYQYWLDNKLFSSKPDGRDPYTVVIPPPNVTGVLHMGHMLNNTIQDILVRRARMEGKNACWVPGTDHASIATEAKVVNRLAQQGIKKTDLTREEFLKHAWDWTHEHGGIILKQLRRLGASCDWDRTAFTMDETRSRAVIHVFCDLYQKGLIYRGVRMVNWDPKAQTALSDEEVIYKDEHSKLYHLKYYVVEQDCQQVDEENVMHKDEKGYYAVVATTRPETIMGDTAMCINPEDKKNTWLKGKHVIVPLVGREIPVIEDSYVDIEFGTGCLKVTPAHDINDHALGLKHGLATIDIFNDNGTISEAAGMYVGMDRMDVRKQISADLQEAGLMEKIEDYNNKVGFSERTNVPIEPKLSTQWFLKMQHFADIALAPVMDDDIEFYPKKYKNTYRHWLENIKDWCISRQLWWGHRIPAYYFDNEGKKDFVVAETAEEALKLAQEKNANIKAEDLEQESDCLDTWFSSWLWPISLFDGIEHPDNEEINYYYPTSDLVTGPDIIFFWVARMIMAGDEFMNDIPFSNVYFTGIVRDKLGRKMSKTLGNSPDPLDLIAKYGADAVRIGMLLCSSAGNDIFYDESQVEQGRNFCNKIWNSFRLVQGWTVDEKLQQSDVNRLAVIWFENKLNQTIQIVEDHYSKFRISDALMSIYKLFWDEYCAWYLEAVKPAYGESIDKATYGATIIFFEKLLKMIHPVMPFITEELWQSMAERKEGETIMYQPTPKAGSVDERIIEEFGIAQEAVNGIRGIRQQKNISPKEALALKVKGDFPMNMLPVVTKLANISSVESVADFGDAAGVSLLVRTVELFVPLEGLVDVKEEIKKIETELEHQRGFLDSVRKKLSNESFVAHAPEKVVALERKKEADALSKIESYEKALAALKNK